MELEKALTERRTIRLYQQREVAREDLEFMLDAARQASCAANLQRLRYMVAVTPSLVNDILALTAWAKLVSPKRTPEKGVSGPAAFIAVLGPVDAGVYIHADAGAAIQSMQLAAFGRGIGCCWLASVDRKAASALLNVPEGYELLYVVAVGYPAEQPCSEDVHDGESVAYYLDEGNKLHVPKLDVASIAKFL